MSYTDTAKLRNPSRSQHRITGAPEALPHTGIFGVQRHSLPEVKITGVLGLVFRESGAAHLARTLKIKNFGGSLQLKKTCEIGLIWLTRKFNQN